MANIDSTTSLRKWTKCSEFKPESLDYFRRDKRGRNNLTSWCKACLNAASQAHYAANREAKIQYRRDYVEANKEAVIESNHRSYQKHRDQYLQAKKRYVAENPEKLLIHWRRMHKMRYYAPGNHTKEQQQSLHDEQDGRCGYCGITLHGDWVPDHINPIALGGSDDIENILICCPPCNHSKSKLTLDVWMKRRGW